MTDAVRPLQEDDLEAAERASDATFLEDARRSRRVREPEPAPRSPEASARWIERMRHYLATDPGGCWVATDGDDDRDSGDIVGFAIAQNRGPLWYLATYGVVPGHQGRGIGRALLDASLAHAGERPGLLISTVHPGATRRYRRAGFTLLPLMRMVGTVDRRALPAVAGLRDGTAADVEWMDRLDTARRGAGHGPDHAAMLRTLRLVVTADPAARPGYVYVDEEAGRPALLAAAEPTSARDLLWEALAAAHGDTLVNAVTAGNDWAVDAGLTARLDIGQEGYLALRGLPEPTSYLPSGQYL